MKKTSEFNNISDKLLASTKLKKGETVTYKVTNINRNPSNPSEYIFPAGVCVPSIDQIWDEELNEFVEIAAVQTVSRDGNHNLHNITFWGSQACHITLRGGIAADQEIHSFLALSNFNGSNPNRDTSKEIIIEQVDENKKSETERKQRNLKREALNLAVDLGVDDVKNLVAALGKDDTRKIDILRNELEIFADRDPVGFLEIANNKQAALKAVLNRALTKGVILFNVEQSMFTWPNNEAILTVSRTTGGDNVDELLSYCISSTKGEKVFQTIQSKSKK